MFANDFSNPFSFADEKMEPQGGQWLTRGHTVSQEETGFDPRACVSVANAGYYPQPITLGGVHLRQIPKNGSAG